MGKVICFDLEGPLSPQDNAYEVMSLLKDGDKIFEVLSFYDDMLTLEHRDGYEPGDTLALIVPFLIYHGTKDEDIRRVSNQAKIVDGAGELISLLKDDGYDVHIISTSYEQHAHNIGGKIGVGKDDIACTRLDIEALKEKFKKSDLESIGELEKDITRFKIPQDQEKIVERLDRFFYDGLLKSIDIFSEVRVVGGERKVEAMLEAASDHETDLKDMVVVGDSITDYKMLGRVKEAGGLAVVFNGNEYAVPYANVGLATIDMRFLYLLIGHDMNEVTEFVRAWEKKRGSYISSPDVISGVTPELIEISSAIPDESFPYFHDLKEVSDSKIEEVVKIHKIFRKRVRGEAAKLG
ncbi:MAG: hypothetical protein SVK08_09235 [Halobacteriota archaeon]|nr:hypothetical protein [Halobacteriota archaeon]